MRDPGPPVGYQEQGLGFWAQGQKLLFLVLFLQREETGAGSIPVSDLSWHTCRGQRTASVLLFTFHLAEVESLLFIHCLPMSLHTASCVGLPSCPKSTGISRVLCAFLLFLFTPQRN